MEYEANLCGVHGEDVSVEATQRAKRKGKVRETRNPKQALAIENDENQLATDRLG
ncbi:hypothetical protein ACI3LZ_000965 [Candidozyma auris]